MGSLSKIRRSEVFSGHPNLWAFLVFICLSVYALGANPFSDETVAPLDRLLEMSGWSSVQSGVTSVHPERSDILDSQLPTWITLKDQIRKGESPLWYPNGDGGQPISLELFNPAFLLFAAVKDNALAYYLVDAAKRVISGFGCYLLLAAFLRWLPSVWGGIVFMLCGFNAAWFFWEQVTTSMWIPWLLWTTVMYLRTEDKKWLPAVTASSLLMIFGGFFAVAGYGFYAFMFLILAWNVYHSFGSSRREAGHTGARKLLLTKTALPLLAVGIAFLMAAAAVLPFVDFLRQINLGYRTGGGIPLGTADMRLLFTYDEPPRVETTAYAGVLACILSLPGLWAAFGGRDRNIRFLAFFNASLVVITISVAFGLLPHGIIEALPVFKNNPKWGRLIVLTLLGLASLSAVGLDFGAEKLEALSGRHLRLTPPNAARLVAVIVVGIIIVQFQSQKSLFNRFNAVVPSAWFYPYTPSLAYVRQHLQPLQSVIADNSYLFAGTLGAYGIPEWYAHSFRPDREKEVLGELVLNPFSSPTSMLIDGSNIQFDSPLMEKLAIRYVLINKGVLERQQLFELPELSRDQAPPLPNNSWKQHISLPAGMAIGAIGFMFDTYGREHAPANVRLSLYNERGLKFSLEPEINGNEISDNRWSFFRFPGKVVFPKGKYTLVLSMAGPAGPYQLTAWATRRDRHNKDNFLEVNGAETDLSLKFRIGYFGKIDLSSFSGKWNIYDLERDILIFENRQVTNSAYFVKDLGASRGQVDFSGLDVRQPSVDRIDIDNSHPDAGWVVVPMHSNPGWKACVDDKQVEYDEYLGMLPAIPVRGPGHIIFKYRSASFQKGLVVSLAGVFIFLVFLGYCYRGGKGRSSRSVLRRRSG